MKQPGPLARVALLLSLGLGMGAVLPGCGGGSTVGPTSVEVYRYEASFASLERFHLFVADFTVPASGDLQIVVDWTSPTDDIDLTLSNPACDATAIAAGICKVLAQDTSNLKPARIAMATTATAYRLFVVNRGPETESGSVVVTVTQSRLVL